MMQRRWVSSASPYENVIGFCRATRVGNQIVVSGTAPIGPDGETVGPDDAYAQAKRCLEVIANALGELDADVEHVMRTRIFLVRSEDWEDVARAHGEMFGTVRPASTFVVIDKLLNPDWLVEIEADALVP